MKNQIILLFTGLLIVSCNNESPKYIDEVNEEIEHIQTLENHKTFLCKVFNDSQLYIEKKKELEKKVFLNRSEIIKVDKIIDSLMPKNIYRVQKYLEKFPYPSGVDYTEEEVSSIYFAIFNHKNKKVQEFFYPELKKAYQNKSIDEYQYLSYLDRFYYLQTTNFYKYNRSNSRDIMIVNISSEIEKTISFQ